MPIFGDIDFLFQFGIGDDISYEDCGRLIIKLKLQVTSFARLFTWIKLHSSYQNQITHNNVRNPEPPNGTKTKKETYHTSINHIHNSEIEKQLQFQFRKDETKTGRLPCNYKNKLFPVIIIKDLVIRNRPRELNNRSADGINPVLLLLLRIRNKIHSIVPSGQFEGELAIEDVLGALDGEAIGDGDDAARAGGAGDVGFLEPEEFALLEDEPAAAPGLDVLPLLGEPPGALRRAPELDAIVVVGVGLRGAHRRSP